MKKLSLVVAVCFMISALSVPVHANDVEMMSAGIYSCIYCGSESVIYNVIGSHNETETADCIHGEGHEGCEIDIITIHYEDRDYYCMDCEHEWSNSESVSSSRKCSCE